MIAAVCGEIEKTQYGDAQGAEYRGYAAGSRYLVTHGGVADMCILGEPTEGKVVLAHFGSLWLRHLGAGRLHPHRVQRGPARPRTRSCACGRCSTPCCEWIPEWEGDPESLPRRERDRQRRRDRRRLRLARLADAAPHRPLPRRPRAADEADAGGARRRSWTWCASCSALPGLRRRGRGRTSPRPAPRSRSRTRSSPRSTRRTQRSSARRRSATSTRWFSDASALTRYGIATVNYGDVERAARRGARREPRLEGSCRRRRSTRAPRCASAGWRERRPVHPAGGPARPRGRRRRRPPARARAARARRSTRRPGPVDLAERRRTASCSTSTRGPAARACRRCPAGTRSRARAAARRSRAGSATTRPSCATSAHASPGSPRRRSTTSSSSRSGTTSPYPVIADPERRLGAALGLPTFDVEGADALQAARARRRERPDRQGLLPGVPARPERRGGRRVARQRAAE